MAREAERTVQAPRPHLLAVGPDLDAQDRSTAFVGLPADVTRGADGDEESRPGRRRQKRTDRRAVGGQTIDNDPGRRRVLGGARQAGDPPRLGNQEVGTPPDQPTRPIQPHDDRRHAVRPAIPITVRQADHPPGAHLGHVELAVGSEVVTPGPVETLGVDRDLEAGRRHESGGSLLRRCGRRCDEAEPQARQQRTVPERGSSHTVLDWLEGGGSASAAPS